MFDNMVRMPSCVQLTDEELQIAEESSRRLAGRYWREGASDRAASWERTADCVAHAIAREG